MQKTPLKVDLMKSFFCIINKPIMMRKSHQLIQLFQDLDLILLALGLQVFSQENFNPHMHLHQLKSRNSTQRSGVCPLECTFLPE